MAEKRWKIAFFITIGIIALLLFTFILIFYVGSNSSQQEWEQDEYQQKDSHFIISTTKAKLNDLIAQKLAEEKAHYSVILKDEYIVFYSAIEVLGRELPVEIFLAPSVVKNGDVVLEMERLVISEVTLPSEFVLRIIKEFTLLPKWITIQPNDRLIHVETHKIGIERGQTFRFKKLDLARDIIELEMSVLFNR